MKLISPLFLLLFICILHADAQNHITRNGKVSFFSHTKIEDIKATNNEVFSSLNTQTGALQYLVLIKSFQFKNASMQQHFNDKEYMNSTEFPKSEFKGVITNLSAINFKKDGSYPATVEGDLTMHGVTNKVKANGSVTVKGGKISSTAVFNVKLVDYGIKVPTIVTAKIAETIEITTNCNYEPLNR
jgi:polyisoprenoid-binding protein YceI